jgi:hypothetical protein
MSHREQKCPYGLPGRRGQAALDPAYGRLRRARTQCERPLAQTEPTAVLLDKCPGIVDIEEYISLRRVLEASGRDRLELATTRSPRLLAAVARGDQDSREDRADDRKARTDEKGTVEPFGESDRRVRAAAQ